MEFKLLKKCTVNCRSRNVFLRITDGKKYCYYGGYAWSCTLVLGILALFAHFTMDYQEVKQNLTFDQQREQIGKYFCLFYRIINIYS